MVDEFGGGLGIVTLDNVIEELVGDIQDEFDEEEREFQKVSDTEFAAKVTAAIGPVRAKFNTSLKLEELDPPNSYRLGRFARIKSCPFWR